jgi:CRISPR-associated protein Csx10
MQKIIPLTIELLSPVVLPMSGGSAVLTSTQSEISGTIVRGLLIGQYLRQNPAAHPEQEDAFRRLFFGDLRYLTAYPGQPGKVSIPLPRSLQKEKDGSKILDLLTKEGEAGYKSLKGLGLIDKGIITPVAVRKSIRLHMSRNNETNGEPSRKDRSHMANERLSGRSELGGIYNYEAIDAGQSFCGAVTGPEEELDALRLALSDGQFTAHLGRSRYTQYGTVRITLSETTDLPQLSDLAADDSVSIRLASPLLPAKRSTRRAADAFALIAEAMNRDTKSTAFSVVQEERSQFAALETIKGFVGIWGMPRPSETALAAGSVCRLKKSGAPWTREDLIRLNSLGYLGVGSRVQEGFGQFRLSPQQEFSFCPAQTESEKPERRSITQPEVKERARRILTHLLATQAAELGAEDVREAFRQQDLPDGITHFLSRLDALLYENKDSITAFRSSLTAELDGKNETIPFPRTLRNLHLKNSGGARKTLEELLLQSTLDQMPYRQEDRLPGLAATGLAEAAEDLGTSVSTLWQDNDIFYAYWHAFFRYGRKYAPKHAKEADA